MRHSVAVIGTMAKDGVALDRAVLQRLMTATTYLAFASALSGAQSVAGCEPTQFDACEALARSAIRQHMSRGLSAQVDFAVAIRTAALDLAERFPQAPGIMHGYASDEIASLVLEELGLLPKTLH